MGFLPCYFPCLSEESPNWTQEHLAHTWCRCSCARCQPIGCVVQLHLLCWKLKWQQVPWRRNSKTISKKELDRHYLCFIQTPYAFWLILLKFRFLLMSYALLVTWGAVLAALSGHTGSPNTQKIQGDRNNSAPVLVSAPLFKEEQEKHVESPTKWPTAGYWCACLWLNFQTVWGLARSPLAPCSLLCRHCGKCYVAFNIIGDDQFGGGSLMVWRGISLKGHTDSHAIASGIMTALRYRDVEDEILSNCQTLRWCTLWLRLHLELLRLGDSSP